MAQNEVVIIDFETTGLSASYDRIIEVGAAVVNNSGIVDTFVTLCNPKVMLPYFITDITGITTSMLKGKPSPEDIMPSLRDFIGERPVLAHNASFDSQFLHSEMCRANLKMNNQFLCTMLLARRLIHETRDHKLLLLSAIL